MLRTLVINSNQIVLSFGVLIAFWSPKQFKNDGGATWTSYGKAFGSSNSWRNQALEPHIPLPKSFKVCKERALERRKTEWGKQGTTAAIFLCTFGALPEVHFVHAIYHFKAQEVKNPILQTVRNSELKRRSCSHCKPITPSWRKHFAKCCEITLLLWSDFAAFLYSRVYLLLKLPDIYREKEAWNLKVEANFAALRV